MVVNCSGNLCSPPCKTCGRTLVSGNICLYTNTSISARTWTLFNGWHFTAFHQWLTRPFRSTRNSSWSMRLRKAFDTRPRPTLHMYVLVSVYNCGVIKICRTFNFVYFMGSAMHKFKIPTKYLFTSVILHMIWNPQIQVSTNMPYVTKPQNFMQLFLKIFHSIKLISPNT